MTDLIARIEALGYVWRLSGPGAIGTDTRAEAIVRHPAKRSPWVFGYGSTAEEALRDVLWKIELGVTR